MKALYHPYFLDFIHELITYDPLLAWVGGYDFFLIFNFFFIILSFIFSHYLSQGEIYNIFTCDIEGALIIKLLST